jgi:hypothetical protein
MARRGRKREQKEETAKCMLLDRWAVFFSLFYLSSSTGLPCPPSLLLLRGASFYCTLDLSEGRMKDLQEERERERERWSVSCLTCFFVFEVLFEECEPDEQVFPPHSSLCFSRLSLPSTFSISLWEPGPSKTPVEDQKTHQQQCLTRKCLIKQRA